MPLSENVSPLPGIYPYNVKYQRVVLKPWGKNYIGKFPTTFMSEKQAKTIAPENFKSKCCSVVLNLFFVLL